MRFPARQLIIYRCLGRSAGRYLATAEVCGARLRSGGRVRVFIHRFHSTKYTALTINTRSSFYKLGDMIHIYLILLYSIILHLLSSNTFSTPRSMKPKSVNLTPSSGSPWPGRASRRTRRDCRDLGLRPPLCGPSSVSENTPPLVTASHIPKYFRNNFKYFFLSIYTYKM